VPFKVGFEFTEELTIDKTTISIGYYKDVNSVIIVKFLEAKEGIWEITLFGDTILSGEYHAWLPITGQVSPWVEFMKPVPEYTIAFPATALRSITCGAYNNFNNTLYVSSSWGPTRVPRMAPDFVAPGVNVRGVYPTGFGSMTGTSVSAAITAGAVALLMEWGMVQGNLKSLDGDVIRLLLISGCQRDEGILYPNTRWGYGKLDLYGTFLKIKETSINYDIPSTL
jgi:subtilisin family serine protease